MCAWDPYDKVHSIVHINCTVMFHNFQSRLHNIHTAVTYNCVITVLEWQILESHANSDGIYIACETRICYSNVSDCSVHVLLGL